MTSAEHRPLRPPFHLGQPVPAHLRDWSVPYTGYCPLDVTTDEVLVDGVRDGWAEPEIDPLRIDFTPRIGRAVVPYTVVDGRPRNPAGRTGRRGRGLGLWGENAAADAVVIAADDAGGRHVLLVRREDCGHWAIPGGMVEPGERVRAAMVRELWEETGVDLSDVTPRLLARTYVDDPRNTDEAWVCTTAGLYVLDFRVDATAGSDALQAEWFPFESVDQLAAHVAEQTWAPLYEAHRPLLQAALDALRTEDSRA